MKKILLGLFLQIISIVLFVFPSKALAFSTNMEASVVIGQPDFNSGASNQGVAIDSNTLSYPMRMSVCDGKLIVPDTANNRVLIYNAIPTTNNASADIVIGQPDFVSNLANQGGLPSANTLSSPQSVACDNTRLLIGDRNNNRVLIYNAIPTTNNASADIVIGQPDFVSNLANQGGTCKGNTIRPLGDLIISTNEGKLFIADGNNQRVLIFNSIPTTNNASADIVVGQPDFTTCYGSVAQNRLYRPRQAVSDGVHLYISEQGGSRVLIFNSIPSSNNAYADIVIGQPDFVSGACGPQDPTPANAYTTCATKGIEVNNGRIFLGDQMNSRILIYNSIPTINYAAADIVIGQPDFQTGIAHGFDLQNRGIPPSNRGLSYVNFFYVYNDKLFVSDSYNNRVLIFDNVVNPPTVGVGASPQSIENGQVRFSGSTSVDSPYSISNVEFAVNGGGWTNASSTDGSFDSTSEEYFFDFDPTLNQPNDSWGNTIEGYTVRIRSTNNNTDVKDRLFYFTPFVVNSPSDGAVTDNSYPSFEFSVNRQRLNMHDGLEKYQIMIKKGGSESQANWETLIDNIPIDFRSVKNNRDNLQWGTWGHLNTDNGAYETNNLYATYQNDSSTIKVYSKTPMSGSYEWKVVAVDKSGNRQETEAREILVNAPYTGVNTYNFPLAVLNISGLGNPRLNVFDILSIKRNYYTYSVNPVFYGIAWSGARVTLKLTDINCKADCSKTYATVANEESRFGINIPKGDLKYGGKYIVSLSSYLEGKYSQLPPFSLGIGALSYTTNAEVKN